MIDTHCHIQFSAYEDDRDKVILRCGKKNLIMNAIGTQKNTSKQAVELAEKEDNIYATIGLHPTHLFATKVDEEESSFLSREENFEEEYYDELAKSEKVIGVGECGLDFFHLPKGVNFLEVLEKQKKVFKQQYDFAQKHDLPLVIHVRDPELGSELPSAYDEMVKLLNSLLEDGAPEGRVMLSNTPTAPLKGGIKGVVHCYSGDWNQAQKFFDLGLYIGFTGIITFPARKNNPKPTEDLLEVVKNIPLDRILVETDAPYLAPQAYRGKKCEPWMVEEVIKKIAEIRGKFYEEIDKNTTENALKLFSKIRKAID